MVWPARRSGGRRLARLGAPVVALVLGAAALAGCAGQEQSGDPAQQVATWVTQGGGGSSVGNLEVEARNIDLALSRHDRPAAIREVCALLSNDAQTGIGNLPTPDQELTTDLDNAYLAGTAAGDDCYKGADGDAALLARSASERTRMVALLGVAVQRMTTVSGRTPTTDTTVPPTGGGDPFAGGT
jgi:hypothetical protein